MNRSDPRDPTDPQRPASTSIHKKLEDFRKEIVRNKRDEIRRNLRRQHFRYDYTQNLQNLHSQAHQPVSNQFSNRQKKMSPQVRMTPLLIERSPQRKSGSALIPNNSTTAFQEKPEINQYEPDIHVDRIQPVTDPHQNINVQNNCQNISQAQYFSQNGLQAPVASQQPFSNEPIWKVCYKSPTIDNLSPQTSQNQNFTEVNPQSLQFGQINPQCYQNPQTGLQYQQYNQMNPQSQPNLQVNHQIQQDPSAFQQLYQQNIQMSPPYRQSVYNNSPTQQLIQPTQIYHQNSPPQVYLNPPQNIHIGSPQNNQNIISNLNPVLSPVSQLVSTPPRSQQPAINHQNLSPILNNPNLNYSFGRGPSNLSPQFIQNINYMDVTFSNQIILQSPMNFQPNPMIPSSQLNMPSQSLLSNQKIHEPNYVNPNLAFVKDKSQRNSPMRILSQVKMEEEKPQFVKENFNLDFQFKDQVISPFSKMKKNPNKTYSALKIVNQDEPKEEQDSQFSFNNKKKAEDLPNSTGKKHEIQVPSAKKENPQKIKHQNNTKKQPIKKLEQPLISNLTDRLSRENVILKLYKHFVVFDKVLGEGSFAIVYLGVNTLTQKMVAVKKMKIKKVKQMFEVNYLKEINHKNVIALYDSCMEENTKHCYLFLEYCSENLRERLKRFKKQKWTDQQELKARIGYIEQLIEGMNALNQKGFIHRDLKFENLLVKDGMLKIGDFGLCRKVNKKLELESIRCGTPYTMAPEIYFHPKNADCNPIYTEKSDIFSMAVIFHELIYNLHPFDYEERHLRTFKRVETISKDAIFEEACRQYGIEINWIRIIIDRGLKPLEQRLTWDELMDIYRNRHQKKLENKNCYKRDASSMISEMLEDLSLEKTGTINVQKASQKSDKKEAEIIQIAPKLIKFEDKKDQKLPYLETSKIIKFDLDIEAKSVFGQQKRRIQQLQKKQEENQTNFGTIKKVKQPFVMRKAVNAFGQASKKISLEQEFSDLPTEVSQPHKKQHTVNDSGSPMLLEELITVKNKSIIMKQDLTNKMTNILLGILVVCVLVLVFERFFLRDSMDAIKF